MRNLLSGRSARKTTIALTAALLLAACGGGGGDDGGESEGAGGASITAEAREFEFDPSEWTAAADTDVTVTLANAGDTEHEWVIIKAGEELESEEDFSEDVVEFEVEAVPPGEEDSGTFSLPAGTYQVICALPGHFGGGMEGTLTLE